MWLSVNALCAIMKITNKKTYRTILVDFASWYPQRHMDALLYNWFRFVTTAEATIRSKLNISNWGLRTFRHDDRNTVILWHYLLHGGTIYIRNNDTCKFILVYFPDFASFIKWTPIMRKNTDANMMWFHGQICLSSESPSLFRIHLHTFASSDFPTCCF